jgi:sulfonate transport system substrate-binding protein
MHVGGQRFITVMLLSLLLTAGTAAAAPITTLVVTVGGNLIISNSVPMIVGVAKGIFEKHGLDIQLYNATSGFDGIEKVVAGNAQVATVGPTAMAQAMSRGADVKAIFASSGDAVGTTGTDNLIAIIARKASGIREGHLEDLLGKKVGLLSGTDFHEYLFSALAAKGLDPAAVTIVSTPFAALPAALQSGAVDAIVITELIVSQALQLSPDAFVVQRGGNHINLIDLRIVSPRYLATHPGTIRRFITAFAEAAQYARLHLDETTDIMTERRVQGAVSRERVRAALGFVRLDPRVSRVTVQAAQEGYDFAIKIGTLRRAPTFEEMFDIRILHQVEREHPELFRDLPPIPDALKL